MRDVLPCFERLESRAVAAELVSMMWSGVFGFGGVVELQRNSPKTSIIVGLDGYIDNLAELSSLSDDGVMKDDVHRLALSYLHGGLDFLGCLTGSFAIAIFDGLSHSLHLVRDEVGSVPLFWGRNDAKEIAFASLPFAVRKGLGKPVELSPIRIRRELLGLGTQAPDSAFVGVESVEPGTVVTLTERTATYKRYRSLSDLYIPGASESSLVEMMRDGILESTTRFVQRSDATVAIALSGGLDSSVVLGAACQSQMLKERLLAISALTYGKSELDREYAEQVVGMYGVNWDCFRSEAIDVPDELVRFAANPVRVAHLGLAWEVFSAACAKQCKSVLTGAAGDVVGGVGWGWQLAMLRNLQVRNLFHELAEDGVSVTRLPRAILGIAMRLAATRMGVHSFIQAKEAYRLRMGLNLIGATGTERSELEDEWWEAERWRRTAPNPSSEWIVWLLNHYVDGELESANVVARALGLEVGSPLVSSNVLSASISLPWNLRRKGGMTRVALREAGASWIPAALKARRKKIDFGDHILQTLHRAIRETNFTAETGRLAEFVDLDVCSELCGMQNDLPNYMISTLYEVTVLERWLKLNVSSETRNES